MKTWQAMPNLRYLKHLETYIGEHLETWEKKRAGSGVAVAASPSSLLVSSPSWPSWPPTTGDI